MHLGKQGGGVLLQAKIGLQAEVLQLLLQKLLLCEGGEGIGAPWSHVGGHPLVEAPRQLQLQRQSLRLQRCLALVARQASPVAAVALHRP